MHSTDKAVNAMVLCAALLSAGCSVSMQAPSADNKPSNAPSSVANSASGGNANSGAKPPKADGEPEYTFKVVNNSPDTIVKLMASEDGKTYGMFDLGGALRPGDSKMLAWDKSTNNSDCEWFFKGEIEGGKETQPVAFDFCEEGLVLELK